MAMPQKVNVLGLSALLLLPVTGSAAPAENFGVGSVIPAAVSVGDAAGSSVSLLQLLAEQPGNVNVLFIFGGGDMGSEMPGHLWCPDSFEDTHILRTLHGKYAGKEVGFVAVASAPVYHSGFLGSQDRVFLDAADDSADFQTARKAFVDSTLAAEAAGILPFTPYFDARFALMLNPADTMQPGAGWGTLQPWHGAFRAAEETQFYGVPSFWLIDDNGKVLAPPFRGNVYHPHGAEVTIKYTYSDLDAAISALSKGSE